MRRTLLFKNIYEFAESIEFMIEIEGTAPLNEIFIQMSKSAIRKAKEIPGWTKDDLVKQRANTLRLWGIHATIFHQTGLSDFKMSGG